jgi:hypothetical protein
MNAQRGLRRGVVPEFEAAWLFKIAQNVCRTRHEKASRRGSLESARHLDAVQDLVAAPELDPGQAGMIAEALRRMPERYRTVILLREIQGLSYREIGEKLELSDAAVEMLVFRARRSLAEHLEQVDEPRARSLGVSSLAGFFKSLFGGGAVKTAVTAAVVVASATAVAVSTQHALRDGDTAPLSPRIRLSTPPVQQTDAVRGAPSTGPAEGQAPRRTGTKPRRSTPVSSSPSASSDAASPGSATGGGTSPPAATSQRPSSPDSRTTSQPSMSTPSVNVPGVTVPGTNVSTPPVGVPPVNVPAVDVPDVPLSTPSLTVPDAPSLPNLP